jgi:filamentous hemagglutinin family protein
MLPQGGHFVAGTGSIGTQGLTETITQSSQRGIIDFNSFSIGKSGTVKINNGTGATLDRVTGGSLSQIMGTLSATGSVFVETSSHGVLAFTGTADRLAPKGKAGTLLLDPTDLDIVAGAAGASTGTSTTGGTISATGTPNPSMLTVGDLQAALAGGNVIVQTSGTLGPANGLGNIDVQASITWSNANSLTLSAFNGITVDSGTRANLCR